ncbi:MAG: hypothetical protein KA368_20855, partial [Acidobacteria bacterium]|nr:hypothetical protein [Acidobacteriota bacterium]
SSNNLASSNNPTADFCHISEFSNLNNCLLSPHILALCRRNRQSVAQLQSMGLMKSRVSMDRSRRAHYLLTDKADDFRLHVQSGANSNHGKKPRLATT